MTLPMTSTGSSTLNYLLGDHSLVPRDRLGSQSITTNSSGVRVAEERYMPWGESRYTYGTTPTTYRYTGQRSETGLGPAGGEGLMYYGARWYDGALGRFVSADSIVPDPDNSQSYDRYGYVENNPIKYTDPFGNRSCTAEEAATGDETCKQNYPDNDVDYILHLVIMDMIQIGDFLGQIPDPDESASGGAGEPKRYSRVKGDEYEIDIFIWLSYKEYKDRSVSPYEITIINSSKSTNINLEHMEIIPSSSSLNGGPVPPSGIKPAPLYITPQTYYIDAQNGSYLASITPGQSRTISLGIYSNDPICQYIYPRIYGTFSVNISIYYMINSHYLSSSYTIPQWWQR